LTHLLPKIKAPTLILWGDKDKVLKVAKNPGGLTQNTGEQDIEFLGMGKQYESGLDYTVMKKTNH